jgi:hypothetical protein
MKNLQPHTPTPLAEHADYFALASGTVIALSVALVFGLTVYAQTDPIFKRSMAFMFMPTISETQKQVANVLISLHLK